MAYPPRWLTRSRLSPSTMLDYRVIEGQCLADVALAAYGDIEGLFWLLQDNPGLSPTERLRGGQVLHLRTVSISPRTRQYLADFGPIATLSHDEQPRGVDYDVVNDDVID
jgi:hypothetical protein